MSHTKRPINLTGSTDTTYASFEVLQGLEAGLRIMGDVSSEYLHHNAQLNNIDRLANGVQHNHHGGQAIRICKVETCYSTLSRARKSHC